MTSLSPRHTAAWAWLRWAAILAFALTQVFLALDDSPTADEPRNLRDGATILHDGRIDVNPEHPPLVKLLAAVALPPTARAAALTGLAQDPLVADAQFGVRLPLQGTNLLRARLLPILVATAGLVAFGSLLAGVSLESAAVATVLLAFAPMWLALGHYATPDAAPVALLLAAAWAVRRFPTTAGGALSGVLLGGALLSKFSAPLLAPFLLLWVFVRCRLHGLAAAALAALAVILSIEAFAVRNMSTGDLQALSGQPIPPWTPYHLDPQFQRIANAVSAMSRPLGAYAIGFFSVLHRSATVDTVGYWNGRLVAGPQPLWPFETLAVKTDIPLLIAAALGAGILWRQRRGIGWAPAIALACGFLYLVAACRMSMHWAARYLLPLVVLLAGLATATLLQKEWRRILVPVLLTAHIIAAAFCFPHFLSYRNAVSRLVASPGTSWDFGDDVGQDLGRALASLNRPVRYVSLLHYRLPEWRALFPLLRSDDDDRLPWIVDRLALDLTEAAHRSDVPSSASRQLAAIQPLLERIDQVRSGGTVRATSEPTILLIEPREP